MTSPGKQPDFPKPSTGAAWAAGLVAAWLCAALLENLGGLLIGGLLGYLLVQNRYLKQAVAALRDQSTATPDNASAAVSGDTPAFDPQKSTAARPKRSSLSAPLPEVVSTPHAAAAAPREIRREPAQEGTALPTAARRYIAQGVAAVRQWMSSGNPMARIGIVVMFFGGAFLAKYSADHGLFPIELRFIALALGALALLALGWRLRDQRATFSQILQGGGIAGLYLTVFAAGRLFSLLPLGLALTVLVLIAISAAILAVGQHSLSLAVIGTAGGFLAPVLVSTGSSNHIALFSYYTILNLGIFAVAWFRAWRVLNWVGFLFTFGITGAFRASAYTREQLVGTDFFLLLFFLLYIGVSILFSLRQDAKTQRDLKGYLSGSLVFGLPVVVFTLHVSLVHHIEFALAFSALGFGLLYAALAWGILNRAQASLKLLGEAFAALAVIFGSLAIPLAFDGQTTAAMWAIEGAGLLWIGLRQQRLSARIFGTLLQLAGGGGYLLGLTPHAQDGMALLNSVFIGGAMLTVAGFVSGHLLRGQATSLHPRERWLIAALPVWGILWWLFTGLSEIDHRITYQLDYGTSLIFLAVSVIGLLLIAEKLHWPFLDRIAVCIVGMGLALGLAAAGDIGSPGRELGLLGWPTLVASGFLLLYITDPIDDAWIQRASLLLHPALTWSAVLVVSWELAFQIQGHLNGIWPVLPWGLVPAGVLWLCSRKPRHWPFTRHAARYRYVIGAVLGVAVLLWMVLVSLSQTGNPEPLTYLPVLNPLDVSLGLCALLVTGWWLRLDREERAKLTPADPRLLPGGAALLALFCLSAALIRALHHGFDVPWTGYAISHSFLVQSSLSIFWSLLGLGAILLAGRRGVREIWLGGAALMVVVVIKLFLVDLAGSGTLARIVSFLSVGALLLLAGYLSPLPPAAATPQENNQ